MNLLILAAAGIGLFLLSGKSESSSSNNPPTKKDGYVSKAPADVKGGVKPSLPKPIGGVKASKCTEYQYQKDGKCVTYWNNEIQKEITDEIIKYAKEFEQGLIIEAINSKLDAPLIPAETLLCYNADVKRDIVKASILNVFDDIKDGELPPKQTSPIYMKKLWEVSSKIYDEKICKK